MHASNLTLANAGFLFAAAVLGGALNAVAGGGSFVAFPALLFTGVPAVPANATNSVALWSGLAFSGGAFRRHLQVDRRVLLALVTVSLVGGVAGAWLLLRTPAHTFLRILPWLMLAATLLFIFGGRLLRTATPVHHGPSTHALALACFFQLLVAIY
ncbi:MAG TPA: sulfite exporter TauE/SafE family protein, partial [Terriglobales bacterium]|nr:sulfite exporter TauE/SafE family protein [Terriglobales bacterium]